VPQSSEGCLNPILAEVRWASLTLAQPSSSLHQEFANTGGALAKEGYCLRRPKTVKHPGAIVLNIWTRPRVFLSCYR
jgi:hypothetical protein